MNRRSLFASIPAAVLASGTASVAAEPATATETPVAQLFRAWEFYTNWLEGPENRGVDDDIFYARVQVQTDLEDRILATPAEVPLDMVMKFACYTGWGVAYSRSPASPTFWAEVRNMVGVSS